MIKIQNVSKSFGSTQVLNSIDLTIEQGKTHVLLGSSGCGKSTLLKITMGLIQPDLGQVEIDDEIMSPKTRKSLIKKIGYVIQEGGLFPHMSAAENVTLVPKIQKWPKEKIQSRLGELAELVDLPLSLLEQFPKDLSGGQKQRVGLMRALMTDPSILLLDEPLGSLDPIVRRDLQDALKKIFEKLKKTVLLVTHDIGEAAFLGDAISLMNHGIRIQTGSFSELLKKPADDFVTKFINAQRPPKELQHE